MSRRWHDEDGTVSTLAAVLAIGLLAMAGLAYDGGAIITATARARDVATAAARTGAQQIDLAAVHTGQASLDTAAAVGASEAFVAQAGMTGVVTVDRASVTVTVITVQPMRLLPMPDRTISATATATAVSDVLGGAP